jgi:hypothetical protein
MTSQEYVGLVHVVHSRTCIFAGAIMLGEMCSSRLAGVVTNRLIESCIRSTMLYFMVS